jgi:hypothetical protein
MALKLSLRRPCFFPGFTKSPTFTDDLQMPPTHNRNAIDRAEFLPDATCEKYPKPFCSFGIYVRDAFLIADDNTNFATTLGSYQVTDFHF